MKQTALQHEREQITIRKRPQSKTLSGTKRYTCLIMLFFKFSTMFRHPSFPHMLHFIALDRNRTGSLALEIISLTHEIRSCWSVYFISIWILSGPYLAHSLFLTFPLHKPRDFEVLSTLFWLCRGTKSNVWALAFMKSASTVKLLTCQAVNLTYFRILVSK